MADTRTPRDDVRRFHVHTCLGSGGFGDVYRATMISAGGVRHEVAVKVLHDGLDPSSQAVQRLRDEGRMLGVLRHPAILRVHDLVVLAGRVALVTEFVEGGDLDQCFKAGDLELRPLVEVIGQVAAALDAAWTHPAPDGQGELHLVHRDVKPANIRVGRHGEVKLLDFGIAKAAGVRREARTQARAVIGSYLYMSPERLIRKDGPMPAGDVYSLGAVLYEGLARRRLFAGVELKDQLHTARDPEGHDRYVREAVGALHAVDPRVRELILGCLHHAESARPTAGELANQCEELADALPGQNLRQWSRRRSWPDDGKAPGELGGRTLTESTILTDTLPAELIATPPPRPHRSATMAAYLDESARPDTDRIVTERADRSAPSQTIVAFDEDEDEDPSDISAPIPKALPVDRTAIRPRKQPPSPRSQAPTLLRPPPQRPVEPARPPPPEPRTRPRGALTIMVLLALLMGFLVVAAGTLAGALFVLERRAATGVQPAPIQGTAAPAAPAPAPEPAPAPAPVDAPAPAPVGRPAPVPTPQPTASPASPEPEEVRVIEVPAPGPAPAPAPTVVVEPEPASADDAAWGDEQPAPAPETEPPRVYGGQVGTDGKVPVELRGRGEVHRPGQVPVGAWEIWADFGEGMIRASTSLLVVDDGGSYTVKCSSLRLQCSASEG